MNENTCIVLSTPPAAYIELLKGHHDLAATLHINVSNVVIRSYQRQAVYVVGKLRSVQRQVVSVTSTYDHISGRPHIRMFIMSDQPQTVIRGR